MKIFEHPNTDDNWKCPICKTNDDKPVTLISIEGTQKDNLIECRQYHVDCIKLREHRILDPSDNIVWLVMQLKGE